MDNRVYYAASVHDEREVEAVLEVLRDPRGLWVGKRVNQMERRVAALFGKAAGVMVNSGSSALYLAVELMGLPPGFGGHRPGGDVLHGHRAAGQGRARALVRRRRARHLQHRRRSGSRRRSPRRRGRSWPPT